MLKKITLIFLIIINVINLDTNDNINNNDIQIENNDKILTKIKEPIKELEKPITNIATLIINNNKYFLYEYSSKNNNVEENVTILEDSTIPPTPNTNIYLAAHSGTGNIAYFNELFKLKENDTVTLVHNNINYNYEIIKIIEQNKDGNINIPKDNQTNLILTTCSNNENKQLIVISKLKEST